MQYRTYKTTMGRKYRMRVAEDEAAERELFHIALAMVPFLGSILLSVAWLLRG